LSALLESEVVSIWRWFNVNLVRLSGWLVVVKISSWSIIVISPLNWRWSIINIVIIRGLVVIVTQIRRRFSNI